MRVFIEITKDNIKEIFACNKFLLITHPGNFHADDVFSTALLKTILGSIGMHVLARSNSADYDTLLMQKGCSGQMWENCTVGVIRYDIGGGDFDHHNGYEYRSDGVPYAAFGKLWRAIGPLFFEYHLVQRFDKDICEPVDAQDNGVGKNLMSQMIKAFNPNWTDSQTDDYRDECFDDVVNLVIKFLERWFKRMISAIAAESAAKERIEASLSGDSRILLLDRFIPCADLILREYPDIQFIIGPSSRNSGEWNLSPIRRFYKPDEENIKLPESWLQEKPEGCSFVHISLTLAAFDNKDDALNAALSIFE